MKRCGANLKLGGQARMFYIAGPFSVWFFTFFATCESITLQDLKCREQESKKILFDQEN